MIYSGDFDYYWPRRPIPLDTSLPENEPQFLINNQIQTILEDVSERKIWIGTSGGLDCFNLITGSFDHYRFDLEDDYSLSSNLVLSMMIDQNGSLWVGTNNGLNEFIERDNRFFRYGYDSQETDTTRLLNNPLINTIFQDRSGAIWVGTSGGGINRFDFSSEFFTHNTHDPNNPETVGGNMIWAFEEDSDIGYWVGTSVGVDRYNTLNGVFEHYPVNAGLMKGSSSVQIFTLHKSYDAGIWAGTSTGLFKLDLETKQFVEYQFPQELDLAEDSILSETIILDIAESVPGRLLIGTYGSGLISIDINSGSTRTFSYAPDDPQGISSNIVSSLLVDTRGITYIGTRGGGLNLLSPDSNEFLRFSSNPGVANSISDNNINQIIQTRDGMIWIATMGGLNQFDPETNSFLVIREEDGLPSNVVYALAEDLQGNLWAASSNGIAKIGSDLEIEAIYQYPNGMQSNEFNPGASFRSNDGLIFFGGTNGFSVFLPELVPLNPFQPPVILGSFTQNREEIELPASLELTHSIELEWPRNYYEFKVSNFNFIQREKNLVAYRLVPLEENWTITGSGVYQQYENLGGGLYTLEIKGSNNDGIWGEAIPAMTIAINPPFWEKRSNQVGAGLILLTLILSGIQIRVRNVQKYSRTLEKEVQERTEDIEKRRKVAEGLREILVRINSNLSLAESLDFVVCQTTRLIESPVAFIFSMEEDKGPQIIALSTSNANQFKDGAISSQIEPMIQEWAEKITKTKSVLSAKINSHIGIEQLTIKIFPILSANMVLGGLGVIDKVELKMNDEDLNLLKSLADQAALAMENARLRKATEEIVVISERNRIARDLHDAITQTLFSANLIAESLPETMRSDIEKGEESLTDLQNLNRSALAEMRALLLELRPNVIKDISISELLRQMADTLRGRAGVKVTVDLSETFQLPEDVHFQFYRIAQEITTNIIKHSRAKNVEVSFASKTYKRSGQVFASATMIIADDGIGFEEGKIQGVHFGIQDIHERAESIRAKMKIDSEPRKGTKIHLEWKNKGIQNGGCN
jgi:signal transduction histidine kinase/ligand-binding sensor domain-containing protein